MYGGKHDDQRLTPLAPDPKIKHDPSRARMSRDGYVVTSAAEYDEEGGYRSYRHSGAGLPRARDYPDPNSYEDC